MNDFNVQFDVNDQILLHQYSNQETIYLLIQLKINWEKIRLSRRSFFFVLTFLLSFSLRIPFGAEL